MLTVIFLLGIGHWALGIPSASLRDALAFAQGKWALGIGHSLFSLISLLNYELRITNYELPVKVKFLVHILSLQKLWCSIFEQMLLKLVAVY